METFTINGLDMPAPSKFDILTQDLHAESTTRTQSGHMVINRIRSEVYKLELGWTAITQEKLDIIKSATQSVTMSVTFRDTDGIVKTKTFYSGDKKSEPRKLFDDDKRWDYSFNLVEV